MAPKVNIIVVCEPSLKDDFRKLAQADGRTLAQYVRECVLRPHLKQRAGHKP